MMPRVAIVVLHYTDLQLTISCIERLCKIDYPDYTVFVIDNASPQPCRPAIENLCPNVQVIRTDRNLGVAGGRNLGFELARQSKAKWVFCVDDDLIVETTTLRQLVQCGIHQGHVAAVGPKLLLIDQPNVFLHAIGRHYHLICFGRSLGRGETDIGQYDHVQQCDWIPGGTALYNLAAIEDLGGFDEHLSPFGPEEQDWFLRARRAGYQVLFASQARVWHPQTGLQGNLSVVKVENMMRGRLLYVRKQPELIVRILGFLFSWFQWGIKPLPHILRRGKIQAYYHALWKGAQRAYHSM